MPADPLLLAFPQAPAANIAANASAAAPCRCLAFPFILILILPRSFSSQPDRTSTPPSIAGRPDLDSPTASKKWPARQGADPTMPWR